MTNRKTKTPESHPYRKAARKAKQNKKKDYGPAQSLTFAVWLRMCCDGERIKASILQVVDTASAVA